MKLEQIIERLAAIDVEIAEATDVETIEARTQEMKELQERKAELEELQTRKDNAKAVSQGAGVKIIERKDTKMEEIKTPLEWRGTPEYRSAYLKTLQGKTLTEAEKRGNEMGSGDVPGTIPTETGERVIQKLKEHANILNEITFLQVPGNVTYAVENVVNVAALHAQNTQITPAGDTLLNVTLGGYEIVKILRISATVKAMAVNAFENWLVDNLSEAVAIKIGEYVFYGTGSSQPQGVDYAATWTDKTNAIDWAGANPTMAELVAQVGLLKAGYHRRAKWAMNRKTFWANIFPIQENDKYKILSDDNSRLLGYEIIFDDNVDDGDVFFGDFKKLVGNLSQNVAVNSSAESGFIYNAVDYRGAAIFDCKVAVAEAFTKGAATLTAGK